MSFMNPVDMVEEDAADLQFPKGKLTYYFVICVPQVKRATLVFMKVLR